MTKPTVKGGLAPANAVEVNGRGAGGERYLTCIWSGRVGPGFACGERRLMFTLVRLKLHKAHGDAL